MQKQGSVKGIYRLLALLSDDLVDAKHKYHINMDIFSMILGWALDLAEDVDVIKWVFNALVKEDMLGGLGSIF